MYGNNDVCQREQTSTVRGLAVTGAGDPLGIITKSHPTLDTQGFQRIQDYALQQQSAKLLHGKSRVCFVVNVRLIKIEIDRLSIIQTLKEHILRMFKDAVLSGIAKSALKRSLKHVEKN